MSHRPIIQKKIATLRRSLQVTPPARFDLVEYLTVRRLAPTKGAAKKMLREGKVQVDGQPVGRTHGRIAPPRNRVEELANIKRGDKLGWVERPLISTELRGKITVVA